MNEFEIGNVGSGAVVVQGENITLGGAFPSSDYRAEVADLLDYYSERFVGREMVFKQIDTVLAQREINYLLVEAPAGYGKSALVTQLVRRNESGQLPSSSRPSLLFFFIREEGVRNTPGIFLPAVNSQLLHILNSSEGVPFAFQAQRAQFACLWQEAATAASAERPLLLLIDGFDEMATERPTIADLLPSFFKPYVHVAVFSRPNPSAREMVPLEHPFRKAAIIRLGPLGLRDIEDLLRSEGCDANKAAILAPRVLDVTRGEPLFARFVCEDVTRIGEQALLDLEEHPPEEVEEYFHRQFEQLDSQAYTEEIIDILGLMLVSYGAMSIEEMAGALRRPPRQVRRAIGSIQRFLLGSDRFELMHLQLRKAIAEDFSDEQREDYRSKLLTWCHSFADAGWPTAIPDYVLKHFAAHLREANDKPALYALINRGWMQLKAARTYSHRSFAEDVLLAVDAAACEDPPNLVEEFRCSLAYATLGSLAANLPIETLNVLGRLGQVTKAIGYASLIPDFAQRSAAYQNIGRALAEEGANEQAVAVLERAVAAAERIEELSGRVPALIGAAEVFAQAGDRAQAAAVLERAVVMAEGLSRENRPSAGYGLESHAAAVREVGRTAAKVGASARSVEVLEGDLDRAVVALGTVSGTSRGDDERQEVASLVAALARLGRVEQVLRAVRPVSAEHKNYVIGDAIEDLARTGEADRAAGLAEQALAAGQIIGEESSWLRRAAEALAEAGKADWALAVAERIDMPEFKALPLAAAALAFARAGRADQAGRAAEQAVQQFKKTTYPVMDLTEVAEMLAQAGETRLAALAAEYTLSKNPNSLAAVALAFAWAGEADQARQAAEQALQQRQSSSDPSSEPGLADLAQAFALIGDVDQAWALAKDGWYERRQVTQALLRSGQLELLFSLADRAADPKSRDVTLGDIADALVEAGELDEALKAARMINHEWQRAYAITSVLHALGKANQPSQAIPLFRQALAVNRKSSRLAVLELLQTACLVIAKIDERITLWRMHEAWTKIDAELASSES